MNKNYFLYKIAILTIGVFLFGSCDDSFLEEKKMWGKYDESIFAHELHTGWYIDKIYSDFFVNYNSPTKVLVASWLDRSKWTEEQAGLTDEIREDKKWSTTDEVPLTYYGEPVGSSMANNPYTRIRNCTFLIDNIDEKGTSMSDDFRNAAKGQMYFLRGLQYYDLVRTYGGIPIVTSIQAASAFDESIKLPRASVTECIKQILKDLDAAAELLPINWGAADYGRFTRAAALAMKSRVLLTYASPLFNKNWDNTNDKRWDAALKAGLAAERELSANGYGSAITNAKQWAEVFYNFDNKFSGEAIMVNLMASTVTNSNNGQYSGWEKSVRLRSQGGNGGVKVPLQMINSFPMKDGTRPSIGSGYNELTFFLDRDPRFYRTFAFSGSVWGTKDKPNDVVWAYRCIYVNNNKEEYIYSDANDSNCPAFVCKMSNPNLSGTIDYSGVDIIYYRYGELLLNIAECYAAKGEIDKCIEYLSKIRVRIGIAKGNNNYGIGTSLTKHQALEACLYERRIELAYEGVRVWDLQRWMLYGEEDGKPNETCQKLGVTPLNGISRIGKYLQAIQRSANNKDEVLKTERANYHVNPDVTTFETDLRDLATFYSSNFELADPSSPLDNINTKGEDGKTLPSPITWRNNYYIWGLRSNILSTNSWLEQTKDWSNGTFDYQDDEPFEYSDN